MFDVKLMLMIYKYTLFRPTAKGPINDILGWIVPDHFEDTLYIS